MHGRQPARSAIRRETVGRAKNSSGEQVRELHVRPTFSLQSI